MGPVRNPRSDSRGQAKNKNKEKENAVKNAQGQLRVLKDVLESRINKRVEGDH